MDTFNRLSFLKGNLKLRATEISPQIWTTLVFDAIADSKPHLNFLPGQHPIKDWLNCKIGEYLWRVTPEDKVIFPKRITPETKCLELIGLDTKYIPIDSGLGNRKRVIEQRLLLSCGGELLSWVSSHESSGYRGENKVTEQQVESAVFTRVSRKGLIDLMVKSPQIGNLIIRSLREYFQKGIDNRKKNLLSMEETCNDLTDILGRIR